MKIVLIFLFSYLLLPLSMLGQEERKKHSVHWSVFILVSENQAESLNDYDPNIFGSGMQLDFKREIYYDNINSLSIGLCNQYGQIDVFKYYFDIEPSKIYHFHSTQKMMSHGICGSNRFNAKFKKLILFMELDLRALIHWKFDSTNNLFIKGSEPSSSSIQTIDLDTNFKFRNPTIYYGLEPGIEFVLKNDLFMFFSTSLRKTINNVNKEIEFSPLIPNFQPSKLNHLSFNFGMRF